MTEQVVDVVDINELPREECIKVVANKILFEADELYKSVETFKQQIPNLPEYVYWILFLRYNKHLIRCLGRRCRNFNNSQSFDT